MVLRFYPTEGDENQYFEVGLSNWPVGELDDDMNGVTKWPPQSKPAIPLIRVQSPCDPEWNAHKIQVMMFYGKISKSLC